MADQKQPKIAIVGASLAGLTFALSLLHHKTVKASEMVILETRSPEARPRGAVSLTPNSLRILDKLGLYERTQANSYNFTGSHHRDAQGNLLGAPQAFGGTETFGYQSLRLERGVGIQVLEAEARNAGVAVISDCSVREVVEETPDSVVFKVRRGGKDGAVETMSAGVLVGADGIHSRVRDWVTGKEVTPIYVGQTMVAAMAHRDAMRFSHGFEVAKDQGEYAMVITTPKGAVLMVAQGSDGKDMMWARHFPLIDRDRTEWEALNNDKKELVRMLTEDKAGMPDIIGSVIEQAKEDESTFIWPVYTLPKLERYVSAGGKSIIIGDAAHTMAPAAVSRLTRTPLL